MQAKSPFKFLDSFDKEDINEFFGRDEETKALFKKTFESNLVLLYGLSGTGKTSLVNCGLSNMFADTDWLPLFIRRDQNIIESLHQGIYNAAFEKKLLEGQPIRKQVHSLYLDYYKPIYLIFDQFEELFILGSQEEASRFFWLLAELLQAKLQVKIILIMREEYLANLDRFEKIIPSLFDNRFRVERMRTEDIQEVITRSADRFGIELEEPAEEVTRTVIDNIRSERGWIDLANLQVYLDRLYRDDLHRKGQENRSVRFDRALLKKTGQLGDVLSRFLDEQLETINRELAQKGSKSEDAALTVLAQLVTNEATKQPRLLGPIVDQLTKEKKLTADEVSYCIERLQEMRIIRYLEAG
ncbi:MAG: AAA family ATPase [Saprospiraceae bacterium]|nr:AAA family ATPase [Saprospiraceae bacterium]